MRYAMIASHVNRFQLYNFLLKQKSQGSFSSLITFLNCKNRVLMQFLYGIIGTLKK